MTQENESGVGKTINKIDTFYNQNAEQLNCPKENLSIYINFEGGRQKNTLFKGNSIARVFEIEEVSGKYLNHPILGKIDLPQKIEEKLSGKIRRKARDKNIKESRVAILIRFEKNQYRSYWFVDGNADSHLPIEEVL